MDMIRLAEGKFNMGCPAAYDVPEKNVKSLKLLRKNRFVYEGMQVNKLLVNNEFKNMSLLAITKARYFEGQISI